MIGTIDKYRTLLYAQKFFYNYIILHSPHTLLLLFLIHTLLLLFLIHTLLLLFLIHTLLLLFLIHTLLLLSIICPLHSHFTPTDMYISTSVTSYPCTSTRDSLYCIMIFLLLLFLLIIVICYSLWIDSSCQYLILLLFFLIFNSALLEKDP